MNIIHNKKQTLNFDFNQDLTGQTGTFYLKDGSTIIFSQGLVAINAVIGTFKLDLTSDTTDEDIKEYSYECSFNVAGIVESGEVYLIENETNRIKEIKQKYKLVFDTATMTKAFNNAKRRTVDFLYTDGVSTDYFTNNKIVKIDNYVADNLNYGFVCKDNIRVYEYSKQAPYTVTELNNNITDILFDYPTGKTIITLDDDYPSDGCSMKVDYKKSILSFSEIYDKVKYIQELYTYLYLLDHTEINKLQLGFTTKDINGISFTFDKSSIDDLKIKIRQWIDNEAIEFEEILVNDVTISNVY